MLESFKGSKERHITNFIKIDKENSYKELIDKDNNVIKRKGIVKKKKKKKTMKGLKKLKLDNIEVKEEKKTKFSLGEIKIAKIHKEATRPLKQKKDLTSEDIKNNSCPCCGLPTKISGKLEDYKICDSPDEFTNCGQGVILYFSFLKFYIFIALFATIGISIFDSYISYYYYSELKIICNNFFDEHDLEKCYYDCRYFSDYVISLCAVYSKEKRMRKNSYYWVYDPSTTLFDTIFFKTSLVNFNNYKIISRTISKYLIFKHENYTNDKYKSTIINVNLVNFLCIISIFIAYLFYIFFMYNKSNAANCSVYTVGDYSIFATNLEGMYKIFKENLEFIQNKENEFNNNYKKLDLELYEEKLGFEPDKNMPKLDLFKKFLEKKLFQNYDIKKIDLCYKLDEIISLQKNIEELDEKIERIEFDQSIIQLNKERGIKGDKRFYYKCFLC